MAERSQLQRVGKNPRNARTKVKSGCRTCKIRKVKCDEGQPACHRCSSTGRVCEGYGIWGGGGNAYGQRSVGAQNSSIIQWHTLPVSTLQTTTAEKGYFEWFRYRTVTKLPGLFASSFWGTLLLQASSNEPAVLHAVLALSSVHKKAILDCHTRWGKRDAPDGQEQFMLRQYSKSITHLQPHFSTRDKTSTRVALVICVVFVSLEFLRGRYTTGENHLQNGLKLLRETYGQLEVGNLVPLISNASREPIDDWIVEVLFRFHVQMELLKHTYQHPYLVVRAIEPEPPLLTFQSINHARQCLDRLLDKILHLTEKSRTYGFSKSSTYPAELLDHQQRIRVELASWNIAYKASKSASGARMPIREWFGYQMLHMYYIMADIMAHACLWPANEGIFDLHVDEFASLLIQAIDLWKSHPLASEALFGHGVEVSGSIADRGWIPPLYYMALKCRVHRIRLHAIELLESTSHKEGVWDARIAASVARKVMEIEERDFYKDMPENDAFSLFSHPEERDLLLPTLPGSYRINEVQFLLPDEPTGNIKLLCKQRQDDGSWEILASEYDVPSRGWIDGAI